MTTRDDFLVAPTATALPDAPSIAPSEDVDSVYVQDEQQQNKEEKPAAVTIQEPVQDNEYIEDMFDDNETLGSMSVMFAEAKSKGRKEPEGNYVPPSHHTYDQDDAMTMGSLASVFSAKQKQAVRKGKRHNAARATGDPIMIPDCQERSVRTALSSTNAAVGPPVDDEDNNTLGGLSGIIGGVNLMEVQQEQHSEKDEETGVMYEYPMKDGSDGTEKSDGSSKKAHFGVNVSFFNRRYSSRRKKIAYCCTCSALVALIAMAVILGVRSLHNRQQVNVPVPAEATAAPIPDKTPPPTTRPPVAPGETTSPTTSPTVAPTVTPTINYIDPLLEFLQDSQVVFDKDPTSPQYMAVQWLAQEANDLEQPLQYDAKLLQRYALLALDFGLGRMLPSNTQTSAPNVVVGFNGTMFANETEMNVTTAITRIGGDVIQDDLSLYMTQNTIAIAGLDECEWERVFCGNGTNAEMVEEIRFSYSMLSGTIAPEIHLLRNTLKVLDLAGNDLQGSIPETLYDLDILEELYLYQNNLTGTLSSKIGNWNNMTRLHLSHNRLNGPIPEALKSASVARPLRYLNLYSNQLTGTIPEGLRLRELLFMDLGRNDMHGPLPNDLGETFVGLRVLHLDHNSFVGTVPESYMSVGNGRLEELSLDHNQLTGFVPDSHTLWNVMSAINLHSNSFDGIGKDTCKLSVFEGGEMVEFSADCDICDCWPLCARCNDVNNDNE